MLAKKKKIEASTWKVETKAEKVAHYLILSIRWYTNEVFSKWIELSPVVISVTEMSKSFENWKQEVMWSENELTNYVSVVYSITACVTGVIGGANSF